MKRKLKKLIIAGSAMAVLAACGSSANAKETVQSTAAAQSKVETVGETETVESTESMADDSLDDEFPLLPGLESGKVKEVTDTSILIEKDLPDEVESTEGDETVPEQLLLRVDPSSTKFIDKDTGRISEAPKVGDEISAWVASEYMASYPAQVNAYVILTSTNAESPNLPMYTDGIEKAEEVDGKVELLDTLNNAKWVFDKSVKAILASTGEEVGLDSIKKGDKCLIWSDPFMITYKSQNPTKVNASRIVILR